MCYICRPRDKNRQAEANLNIATATNRGKLGTSNGAELGIFLDSKVEAEVRLNSTSAEHEGDADDNLLATPTSLFGYR
jgi:hypothetical protein